MKLQIRNVVLSTVVPVVLVAGFFPPLVRSADLTAVQVVDNSSRLDKVSYWRSAAKLLLTSDAASARTRDAEIHVKLGKGGDDAMRLIRFSAPADIRGTSVLIHEHQSAGDDIWIYLPSLKKTRRLLASNRKDSFVGTDFSYSDIVTPKTGDYNYRFLPMEDVGGVRCYVIESIPKSEQIAGDTGYSKVISWMRTDNFLRIKADFYDLSGAPYKAMRLHASREVGSNPSRVLAEKIEMRNLQTSHTTVITFTDIKVGEAKGDAMFSPQRLEGN